MRHVESYPSSPTLHEVDVVECKPSMAPRPTAPPAADLPAARGPATPPSHAADLPAAEKLGDVALYSPGKSKLDELEEGMEPAAAAPVALLAKGDETLTFPDGGWRAWSIVVGALHMTCCTFGMTNSWGVFQQYYQEVGLSGQSSSAIAWIGSMQYALVFLPSLACGIMLDRGVFLVPFTVGAVVYPLSLFLTAQTTTYWQVLLSQGIMLGLGAGILFSPTLAVVSHWFMKKRMLAFGIIATGSSIGGTFFPIAIRRLLPRVGYPWTLRICGFCVLWCVIVGWCTLRPRLRPKVVAGGIFNFGMFRSASISLYFSGCFLIMLGLYTPLSYLEVAGKQAGIGEFSVYLISIANAFSIVGRIVPGYFADKVGPVNMLLPASTLAGIMMFIWPTCTTRDSLIAFAALYGAACGSFVSLFSPGIAQLGETADIGRRMGMLTTFLSLAALCGPPISGAILQNGGEDFMRVAAFTGSVVFAGCGALFASRYLVLGGLKGRM